MSGKDEEELLEDWVIIVFLLVYLKFFMRMWYNSLYFMVQSTRLLESNTRKSKCNNDETVKMNMQSQ